MYGIYLLNVNEFSQLLRIIESRANIVDTLVFENESSSSHHKRFQEHLLWLRNFDFCSSCCSPLCWCVMLD